MRKGKNAGRYIYYYGIVYETGKIIGENPPTGKNRKSAKLLGRKSAKPFTDYGARTLSSTAALIKR